MPDNIIDFNQAVKDAAKENKPVGDQYYAIARPGSQGIRGVYEYVMVTAPRFLTTTDARRALKFTSRMEANMVARDLPDDNWTVVSCRRELL